METSNPEFDIESLLENEFHLTFESGHIGDNGISQGLAISLPSVDYYEGIRILEGWDAPEVDFGASEFGNEH
jgi:hypothetical protein